MRTIGVFGGAFNPPHKGHVRLARDFAGRLSLDKVLVIPSFLPPHKTDSLLATAEDRLAMCRLAFGDDDRFEVSGMEIERGGKSYTYDTLRALRDEYPDAALYLIVGSDMLASFETWHRWRDILSLCTLCAARRKESDSLCKDEVDCLVSDLPALEVSSTEIRDRLAQGEDIAPLVGSKVADYIRSRGLYGD